MKTKLIILLLAVCLLTGCGEKESDKNISETKEKTTASPKADTEEIIKNTSIFPSDAECSYSEVVVEVKDYEKKKIKDSENQIAKKIGSLELEDVDTFYYDPNYKYRVIKNVDDLDVKLSNKCFEKTCVAVESINMPKNNLPEGYNIFNDNYINSVDWSKQNKIDYMEVKEDYYKGNTEARGIYIIKNDSQIIILCDENFGIFNESVSCGNTIATVGFKLDGGSREEICIANIKDKTYRIIDFRDLIASEYGVCKSNPMCTSFYDEDDHFLTTYYAGEENMMFLDENTLVVRTFCNHVFVYDIEKEHITDCIWLGENVERVYLKDGICNVTYKLKDDNREYRAIDMKKMQVVSCIKNDLYGVECIYKKGITYMQNEKGLYVYNPETKGYDVIYDQMSVGSKYPDMREEVIDESVDDDALCLENRLMFEEDAIYLARGVYLFDSSSYWQELIYKKLTLK